MRTTNTDYNILPWIMGIWSLLIVGCTKVEREDDGPAKKSNTMVHVLLDDAADDVALGDSCSRLSIAVFESGQRVGIINQSTDGSDRFGEVDMQLPAGTYQVVAIAHSGSGNPTITNPEKVPFAGNKCTDTFSAYTEITIPDSLESQINEFRVNVRRVTSCIKINITGEFPPEVTRMKFRYTGGSSTLNAVTGYGCVKSTQTEYVNLSDAERSTSGRVFRIFTFPHDRWDEITVFAYALDSLDNVVYEREFLPLEVEQGQSTTYSHKFFPGW